MLHGTSIDWSSILGGDLTLSKDWLETRLVYIQSNTQENLVSAGWNPGTQSYSLAPSVIYPPAKQQIYGLAFKADYQNWLIHSEIIQIDHPGLNYKDHAQLVALGYHYAQWQPILTWGRYKGSAVTDGLLPGVQPWNYNQDSQQTVSMTLRYDVNAISDVKVQFDSETDHSDPGYSPNYGNARLLTFTYDRVF